MVGSNTFAWEWNKITEFGQHLKYYLKTKSLPNGLLGYAKTTPGDPWSTQWQDLKTIMATTWKEDMTVAMPLVSYQVH